LAYLHDWLSRAAGENQTHLRKVLNWADNDDWRHAFRDALVNKDAETLKVLADGLEIETQPAVILSALGGALLTDKHTNAARALLQKAQQRYPGDFWLNYLLGSYWSKERPRVAVGYFRVAVAIRPTNDQAYTMLARALHDSEDTEGSIAAFEKSFELNPNYPAAKDLITAQVQRGRLEDARSVWEKVLDRKPQDHDPWYGYAELCLFLGKADEYRRARRALLERFGTTTNLFDAERTARACLLLPATGDELRQAVDLAQRAVAVQASDKWGHTYFQFVQGLAAYREGQFARAITTMRGDASTVLGPAPGLVLAMALHRSGSEAEAREVLAKAILAHDWRALQFQVIDPSGWIYHILRREAESMMLPNLPAFMDGKHQPQDNDERLALLGACQFKNRTHAMARLYADAFAADPPLANDLGAGHRYNAARAAAQAGCERGEDATGLGEGERKRLRDQAREWLRAELAARARALDTSAAATRETHRLALTRWRSDPDLAGLREPAELGMLPANERKEFITLWADLDDLLARTQK
jgi:serine/threonine-protein kinase